MDGTLGSQTARMLDGTGVEITSREALVEILRRAAPAGWPVAVHAIGDLANREALDAFEETRAEWAPLGLRNRIEHAQLLAPEDVGRFAEARRRGLRPVQPCHVGPRRRRSLLGGQDGRRLRLPLAAGLRSRRRERLGRADRGARPARGDPGRRPPDDRRPARLAPRADADRRAGVPGDLRHACVAQLRRAPPGKLVPGYLADLVVLDRDPFELPPEELAEVQVVATMVGGRWTHNPPPWD